MLPDDPIAAAHAALQLAVREGLIRMCLEEGTKVKSGGRRRMNLEILALKGPELAHSAEPRQRLYDEVSTGGSGVVILGVGHAAALVPLVVVGVGLSECRAKVLGEVRVSGERLEEEGVQAPGVLGNLS